MVRASGEGVTIVEVTMEVAVSFTKVKTANEEPGDACALLYSLVAVFVGEYETRGALDGRQAFWEDF
jgi:hypothetical protein